MMRYCFVFLGLLVSLSSSYATNWEIGPNMTYTMPSQVSNLVVSGDTVSIQVGIYESDVARWQASNLLLRGVGGMAHLKANGNAYGGKAIWVIAGDNVRVENIEFSLCAVPDHNGAGIRQEGHNLMVSHCYFHHNEDGILAGTINPSKITIEYSEFAYQGYGDGLSHNLYINNIDTLIFRYNYSHHCAIGHELKSRARVNFILYNRLSNEATGTASRCLDLPNGGTTYLIGNVIEQGPLSENYNIIGYGLEGLSNPTPHELYAVNNTIVNDYPGGSFFQFNAQTALFKAYNNLFAGEGSLISGNLPLAIDSMSNIVALDISSLLLLDAPNYNYYPTSNSVSLLNNATVPGTVNGVALYPNMEYEHPANATERCVENSLDIGAFEFCSTSAVAEKMPSQFSIYPNPVVDLLFIQPTSFESRIIRIYSSFGQFISQQEVYNTVDVSELETGIYWLIIQSEGALSTLKFIKTP